MKQTINSKDNVFFFYDYILYRIAGRRTHTIVQDLIDDMRRDVWPDDITGPEIVSRIRSKGCSGARAALAILINGYRNYCRTHGYVTEALNG